MGKLLNLLRWRKEVKLIDQGGEPIKDDKGKPVSVWLRIIGDEDQQEAYRNARVKSYEKRLLLRDENSADYKDEILPIQDASKENCIELIRVSRASNFTTMALANVERPELPTMEEIAIDADGPSLEEQEKLDQALLEVEKDYQAAIAEYIAQRKVELDAELESMDLDTLRQEAMADTANAMALAEFLREVQDEKVWRAVYEDEACTKRALNSLEEFRALHSTIKRQLTEAYGDLEMSPEDIKN